MVDKMPLRALKPEEPANYTVSAFLKGLKHAYAVVSPASN